jgi:hypothetical protein
MTLHEERAQAQLVGEGITFLGFRVFPNHHRLNSRRGHSARRHLQMLAAQVTAGRLPLARLSASVMGWVVHAAHGDTYGLRRVVLSSLHFGVLA